MVDDYEKALEEHVPHQCFRFRPLASFLRDLRYLVCLLFFTLNTPLATIMSDREVGPAGGIPGPDDDLSLPKATVAKMITGASFPAVHYSLKSDKLLLRAIAQRYYLLQRD
jgi:hypothetical protein